MYCYDFMLTFDQQIRFFKGRKFSISTVLFVMLHMTGFLAVISLPLAVFVPSIKVSTSVAPGILSFTLMC